MAMSEAEQKRRLEAELAALEAALGNIDTEMFEIDNQCDPHSSS